VRDPHTIQSDRPPGVLVVDDEESVRSLLVLTLPRFGFRVWAAAGGAEALSLFQAHAGQIDAALLDVMMPGQDGPAVLRALRGLAPALPCCFMTADAGKYGPDGLLALGAAHVFIKPFLLPDLAAVMRGLCASR
jgi:CheY-like chemotaxis protein